MSDRKKVILAIVGSLILHIIIILGSGKVISLWPDVSVPVLKADEKPPELTLVDTPPPEENQNHERQYLRTNDDQKTDKKPVDADFQSDKDTAAASEKPASGTQPVPTQDGKDLPDIGFKNEDSSLAANGQNFAHDPGLERNPAPAQQKQDNLEEPKPDETPTPTPEPKSTPPPTPPPTPEPTPTATPDMVPTNEELAMLRPTPTPMPTPVRRQPTRSQRASAPPTAYRPEQRITRMQGSIDSRGRASIAALGTPQGRFEKAVTDAVGSRWYYYVRERSDLISLGTVQIRFYVRPDGRVEDVTVLRNSANQGLASASLQSIIDAEIPPIPDDLTPVLSGGRMEFTMSFTSY
jgi:outer membrane biosynthesis protein TonB